MRKNRTRSGKIITVALAATFAVSLLAGCNGADSESTEKNKGTTEVSTEATTEKTEAQATEAPVQKPGWKRRQQATSTEAKTETQTTEAASSEEDAGATEEGTSTAELQAEAVSALPGYISDRHDL